MNAPATSAATATSAETSARVLDRRGRPLRDLRISVTDRCNFRCNYCMPRDVFGRDHRFLPKRELLRYEEIEMLARAFIKLGVHKIRLTGGEPLLRRDLEDLIARLAQLDGLDDLALTTNASLLTPARANSLRRAGIRRINISLDALDDRVYRRINQIDSRCDVNDILRGVDNALSAGFDTVKVNMVVQKGINEQEIVPMARRFRGGGAILRFIEFMDVGNHNRWSPARVFSAREIIAAISAVYPLQPLGANYAGEVAKRWRYVDGGGEVGVIASVSQPFCADCSRARLSALGEIYTCLFAARGFDLREWLRAEPKLNEEELRERIGGLWRARRDQYSVERALRPATISPGQTSQKVEMSYIGG